ncbi:MAG TPA: sigma-70 family RNA polymerase sigma factor [Xanthobacteraceae bacterium]|nr:sigma-70 family RNA polymerase sigma factor [Xanthobacteraceae bacterium]
MHSATVIALSVVAPPTPERSYTRPAARERAQLPSATVLAFKRRGQGAAQATPSPSTDMDYVLIRAIAAGSKPAMRTLFLRHHARVLRYAMRIVRDHALAEDVLSEVFLDVWRRADRFAGRSSVATWICGIARHKALTALEAKPPTHNDDDHLITLADPAPGPDGGLDAQDRVATLQGCIDALSREHREIIDLVYFREKSFKEIAAMLGIGLNTVKSRVFYARKRLATLLATADLAQA